MNPMESSTAVLRVTSLHGTSLGCTGLRVLGWWDRGGSGKHEESPCSQ